MITHCTRCGRVLTATTSAIRGLGPVCAAMVAAEIDREAEENADQVDLPFNSSTMDVHVRRDEPKNGHGMGVKHFNIYQVFKHHSPTGFGWGFGGSGPADFALNILALFIQGEKREVGLWDGQKVSRLVWDLHQPFKWKFVSRLPKEGGTIKGDEIRAWIKEQGSTRRG